MDHYSVLGISKTASEKDIKTAYRKKSKTLHPDKGGNKEKFVELNDSYSILIDDVKRKIYDQSFIFPSFKKGEASHPSEEKKKEPQFNQPFTETKKPQFNQPFTENKESQQKRSNKWTLIEEQLLLSKIKEKKDINVISYEMNRSVGAIRARISKLKKDGLLQKEDKKNMWTIEEENILRKKVEEVKDIEMIADEMGKTQSQIKYKMKLLNLILLINREKSKRFWTTEEENILLEKYNQKIPIGTICEQMGRSISALNARLRKIKKLKL